MIASAGAAAGDFFNYPASASTADEQKDYRGAQRNLMVVALVAKVYIVQFLKNNQDVRFMPIHAHTLPYPSASPTRLVCCLCAVGGPGERAQVSVQEDGAAAAAHMGAREEEGREGKMGANVEVG